MEPTGLIDDISEAGDRELSLREMEKFWESHPSLYWEIGREVVSDTESGTVKLAPIGRIVIPGDEYGGRYRVLP